MNRARTFCLLSLVAGFASWAVSSGAEATPPAHWPSWRGPTANSIAAPDADPPIKWSETENLAWKAPLPGRGSATPVVWGNQIFVLSASETSRTAKADELPKPDPRFETKTTPPNKYYRFQVTSFDKTSGKVVWQKTAAEAVPHEGHHPTHSYAAGSPATDGKTLVASFGSFGVYAFDLDGNLKWKRDLGRLRTRLGWGEAVTPVIHGNSVILNWDQEVDSRLLVLNLADGTTRLDIPREEKSSWNTPLVVNHQGKTQVILNGTNRVRSYDLQTGEPLWQVAGMTVNAIPSPLSDGQTAYIASGYRGAAAIAVKLDARGDLTEGSDKIVWRHGKGTPYVPSPLLWQGKLFMTKVNTPFLTVLDATTGKPLVEDMRLPKATSFYASPTVAAGRIYLPDRDGNTVILDARDKPTVLATNSLDDHFDASAVAIGKTLYLRGEKYLYAIGR